MMRFAVETWAPEYGAPAGEVLAETTVDVDLTAEVAADAWSPIDPAASTQLPDCIVFVDGVRRVDARVWVSGNGTGVPDAAPAQGFCASYAAGAVRCDGRATLVAAEVRRGLFCCGDELDAIVTRHGEYAPRAVKGDTLDALVLDLQRHMADLEAKVAVTAGAGRDAGALVVVDGPLRDRRHIPGVVGYVKTHHVAYLAPGHAEVVGALRAGQRTPVFGIGAGFPRWSWYVRLPGAIAHPWSGVVRCEAPPDLTIADVVALADTTALALPRFASQPHKDPRAPQNLHPIAGLERELRRRLGDPALLERALRRAAASG